MRMCRLDRRGGDLPIRFRPAAGDRMNDGRLHLGIEANGGALLALFGHSMTNGIAWVEFVGLDETEPFVPGFRPVATLIAGKPKPVPRHHDVVAKGTVHRKPRPLVAGWG